MEVLDMNDACEFLNIAKPTLYRYVRVGKIPGFKVGKIWRFHKASLEAWVAEKMREETEQRRALCNAQ